MNTKSLQLRIILLLFVILSVLLIQVPSSYALDATKVVLPPVSDKSGYNDPSLNAALLGKLRSQFRFPKYETILTAPLTVGNDRSALEKITADNAADGAVVLEINTLRTRSWTDWYETYEQTQVALTLTYFDKQTGKYGQFKANRSIIDVASVFTGALPESLDAMEELLNKLDSIFPRQFPGPRY